MGYFTKINFEEVLSQEQFLYETSTYTVGEFAFTALSNKQNTLSQEIMIVNIRKSVKQI